MFYHADFCVNVKMIKTYLILDLMFNNVNALLGVHATLTFNIMGFTIDLHSYVYRRGMSAIYPCLHVTVVSKNKDQRKK